VSLSVLLVLASLGCVLLFGARWAISRSLSYRYLLWNLLLAFVPYIVAALAMMAERRGTEKGGRSSGLIIAFLGLFWLFFYPNAPYIFTDFIHVFNRSYLRAVPAEWIGLNALIWYDIIMNAAFAFIGHFIGLVSMWLIERVTRRAFGRVVSRFLVAAAILLSGFGIYLGRFSRLNSWDVLSSPLRVAAEVLEAVRDPKAILFSSVFSLFIALSFGALVAFKRIGSEDRPRSD
jgi:uncharacterized membrane protein